MPTCLEGDSKLRVLKFSAVAIASVVLIEVVLGLDSILFRAPLGLAMVQKVNRQTIGQY